ncbi:MAG: glycosyltransferase [Pseudomonadota bacterium]
MPRIGLVFHGLNHGGIERTMLRLGEGLQRRGCAVDIVVGDASGPLRDDLPAGVNLVQLDKSWIGWSLVYGLRSEPEARRLLLRFDWRRAKRLFRRLPALVDYFCRYRPDGVFAADPGYNALSVWAGGLSGLHPPVVVSERNPPSRAAELNSQWSDRGLHAAFRNAYLRAHAIAAVSDGVAEDLSAYADIPRQRITTTYNPVVDQDISLKVADPVDHPWFAPGQPPMILGVGRIHPQKDFATLIRAFAKVRGQRPARLVIIGATSTKDVGYAEELRELSAHLGIGGDVDLPGFVANPFAYMGRAAVFVLSSLYEGLPGVLIQALACGTPVVSTDCTAGPAEILDGGRFGRLVPIGDDTAMAAAILETLERPAPPEQLRSRAQSYSVDRAVDRCLAVMFAPSTNDTGSEPLQRAERSLGQTVSSP